MARASKKPSSKKPESPFGSLVAVFAIILIIIVGGVLHFSSQQEGQPNSDGNPNSQGLAGSGEEGVRNNNASDTVSNVGLSVALIESKMPSFIFSTTGVILEVLDNAVVIKGDGGNFPDRKQSDLTCLLTEETKIFTRDKKKYKGMNGLDVLKQGMNVLVDSAENIREKTSFTIKNISILD